MKNKKGFTLVELLVVIVILGIITGISIPLIRNVQKSMVKKKYTTYLSGLKTSAKLYKDSYSEDMFGHNKTGVYCITYEELKNKNLLKDISIDDVSCDRPNTYVRVVKIDDKYVYTPFLACGDKRKEDDVKTVLPENSEADITDDFCSNDVANTIQISADETYMGEVYDKKRKKTRLNIESVTGIYNKVDISIAWSTEEKGFDKVQEWTTTQYKIDDSQKQEESIFKGQKITTKSQELITPAGKTGVFYLLVKVDYLKDIYGNRWVNPDPNNKDSKYLSFGPFTIDNEPPTVPTILAYKKKNATDINSATGLQTIATNTWHKGWIFTVPTAKDNKTAVHYYYILNTGQETKGNYRNINTEGTTKIKYKACDQAKNCSEYSSEFVVKLDRTAPTCGKATNASTTWTKSNRTIKQACSEGKNQSGCVKTSYDTTYSSTTKTSKVTIADKVGNTKECSYNVYVDKTAPTCGKATNASTTWTNSNRTIKQACSDGTNQSGCVKASYDTTYSTSIKTSKVTIADKAGNTKECSYNVYVDKNAPTCSSIAKVNNSSGANYSGSLTCSNVYTSASCSDTGGSGCSSTKSITTTGATQNVTDNRNYSSWTVEAKGSSKVTWKVFDNAGNSKTCGAINIKKGTNSSSSACGCASYNYPCTKTRTYYSYAMSTARKCQPSSRQAEPYHCNYPGSNTDTNMCCRTTHYESYSTTCTSSTCQQYNTCCHE